MPYEIVSKEKVRCAVHDVLYDDENGPHCDEEKHRRRRNTYQDAPLVRAGLMVQSGQHGSDAGSGEVAKEHPRRSPVAAGLALQARDTGRVLMLQRSLSEDDDSAGKWELPGGKVEDGDQNEFHTAAREWEEEVGQPLPESVDEIAGEWDSPDGKYRGFLASMPREKDLVLSDGHSVVNPDDPDGDDAEQAAWWYPQDAMTNPALREEVKDTPWEAMVTVSKRIPEGEDSPYDPDQVREFRHGWIPVLSAKDFNEKYPEDKRIYRGVNSEAGAAATRRGELGSGDFGKGLYFGGFGLAQAYTDEKSGRFLRAGIREDAVVKQPPNKVKYGSSTGMDKWAEKNNVDIVDMGTSHLVRNPQAIELDENDYTADQSVVMYYRQEGYDIPEKYQNVTLPGDDVEKRIAEGEDSPYDPDQKREFRHGWIPVGSWNKMGAGEYKASMGDKNYSIKLNNNKKYVLREGRRKVGEFSSLQAAKNRAAGGRANKLALVDKPGKTLDGDEAYASIPRLQPTRKMSDAIEGYELVGYRSINSQLREGDVESDLKKDVEAIEAAFDTVDPLKNSIEVKRGVPSDVFKKFRTRRGQKFVDKGFVSTTTDTVIADAFSKGGVVLDIVVPAGSKVLALDDTAHGGRNSVPEDETEQEVLLPHGSVFEIIGGTKLRFVGVESEMNLSKSDRVIHADKYVWDGNEIEWLGNSVNKHIEEGEDSPYDPDQKREFKHGWIPVSAPVPEGMHEATDEERKKLRIPPAWTNVVMADDPTAALQARGRDAKGRVQSVYSAEHTQGQAAKKFARVQSLVDDIDELDTRISKDWDESDEAAALMLIRQMGLRPGSNRNRGAEKAAFGATNLLAKHVQVQDDGDVSLHFTGKKGVDISLPVEEPEVEKMLKDRVKGKEPGDPLFDTNENKVRDYFKSIVGEEYNLKDLRTVKANILALQKIRSMDAPNTKKEFQKSRNTVADFVSNYLGNTRSVALASYINPTVFADWQAQLGEVSKTSLRRVVDPHPRRIIKRIKENTDSPYDADTQWEWKHGWIPASPPIITSGEDIDRELGDMGVEETRNFGPARVTRHGANAFTVTGPNAAGEEITAKHRPQSFTRMITQRMNEDAQARAEEPEEDEDQEDNQVSPSTIGPQLRDMERDDVTTIAGVRVKRNVEGRYDLLSLGKQNLPFIPAMNAIVDAQNPEQQEEEEPEEDTGKSPRDERLLRFLSSMEVGHATRGQATLAGNVEVFYGQDHQYRIDAPNHKPSMVDTPEEALSTIRAMQEDDRREQPTDYFRGVVDRDVERILDEMDEADGGEFELSDATGEDEHNDIYVEQEYQEEGEEPRFRVYSERTGEEFLDYSPVTDVVDYIQDHLAEDLVGQSTYEPGEPFELEELFDDMRSEEDRINMANEIWGTEHAYSGIESRVTTVYGHGDNATVKGILTKDGDHVGEFERTIDYDHVHHDLFKLDYFMQGQGFAEKFNDQAISKYQDLGISRVELFADITIGGYAWAKQGFEFQDTAEAERFVREFIQMYGQEYPNLVDQAQELLDDIQSYEDQGSWAYRLSRLGSRTDYWEDDGRYFWPGKDFLLGKNWHGEKDIG